MNSSRRADLQRKLSLNAVPRPPADLAAKIKSGIPPDLAASTARRPSPWALRVAASVAILASSVLAAFLLLREPDAGRSSVPLPARARPVPAAVRPETAAAEPGTAVVRLRSEATATLDEAAAARRVEEPPPAAVADLTSATSFAPQFDDAAEVPAVAPEAEAARETRVASITTAPAPPAEAAITGAAPASVAQKGRSTGAVASERASPAAPAPEAPAFARAEAQAASAQAGALSAAVENDAAPARAFGVSLDAGAFDRVRRTIEAGSRPAGAEVDVEAIVNYFTGPPARAPREGLRLEVEASPAPVRANGERAILRVTVDAAPGAHSGAAARHVEIGLRVDSTFVASFRRIGRDTPLSREPLLPPGTSVTVLYELIMKPGLTASQRVAMVRLAWTPASGGGRRTSERQVTGRELAIDWSHSSRRHRLAAVGALWGEALRGTGGTPDLAQEAEDLATQEPGDRRARELADVASASSKLTGSRPTGSGR